MKTLGCFLILAATVVEFSLIYSFAAVGCHRLQVCMQSCQRVTIIWTTATGCPAYIQAMHRGPAWIIMIIVYDLLVLPCKYIRTHMPSICVQLRYKHIFKSANVKRITTILIGEEITVIARWLNDTAPLLGAVFHYSTRIISGETTHDTHIDYSLVAK